MMTRNGPLSYGTRARFWAIALRGAADTEIRRPLWEFPPEAREAVKHERRRRFNWDIDSEGEH
jgi:hypothetical protein